MHNYCPTICTGKKTVIQQGKEQESKINLGMRDKEIPNVVCVGKTAQAQGTGTGRCGILLLSSSYASPNPYNRLRISKL